ncbi:threonine/serine exporter family protein [Malaciobacter pacificus]|uniref:threonine/serine ThrE exporter family protein n=1 Tax=Malaciobacter pacificus TaxID=1080223 RepID=UPI00307A01AD
MTFKYNLIIILKNFLRKEQIIDYEEQSKITRVIIKAAVLMLEFGAESILIEQTAQRLGKALGVDSVEISLIPSAIVLTTLLKGRSATTTRRVHHKPINMSIVCDVQKMVIEIEKDKHDSDWVTTHMKNIQPNYYNRWLVILMVGLACASFSYLYGADIWAFAITFISSSIAMYIRQELSKKRFMLILTFGITAFIATLLSSTSLLFNLTNTPNVVFAASVLLLVPGFPFVTSFLDGFKGYLSMAWGRWLQASLLTIATCMGIILAMSVLNIKGW